MDSDISDRNRRTIAQVLLNRLANAYLWDAIIFCEQFWVPNKFDVSRLTTSITDAAEHYWVRETTYIVRKQDLTFFYVERIKMPVGEITLVQVDLVPAFDVVAAGQEIFVMNKTFE